jgi:predicted nucleic acid-binding protein
VILDTSGLLAALDPDEAAHTACRAAIESERTRLVVSPFVLCELDHLLGQRTTIERRLDLLLEVERGAIELAEVSPGHLGEAAELMATFADLDVGLTDAHLAVLARSSPGEPILTLDERHFRTITHPDGTAFTLYPADLA